jgi:acyl dehydratase
MAAVIAGDDAANVDGSVPPTFAAVYCLAPSMAQLFGDAALGINLAGMIHGEQRFEWPALVTPGDVVDCEAEIVSVEEKRGMTFLGVRMQAHRPADGVTVCRGTSVLIIRGTPS